jgi:hypothetical protein
LALTDRSLYCQIAGGYAMKTYPQVSFGLFALDIKADGVPTTTDIQSFSKINDLKNDSSTSLPYATYEPDYWLLDGGYKFLPSNTSTVHPGWISNSLSDSSGNFSIAPVLTITFQSTHTVDGITLHFDAYTGDYATSVKISWYNSSNALISEATYSPTSAEFSLNQTISNFKKIVLTFYSTNRPYRYLRVSKIDYGPLIYFGAGDIREAHLVEEIDMLGGEARFNVLELRLHSENSQFSIINPAGYYQYLQQRQPIVVHEWVDNQSLFMGQFYVDTWENKTDKEISFHCVDLLGVLETITYRGGLWSATSITTLLDAMLAPIGVAYDLDTSLSGATVTGWIPYGTYRRALQQIAFSIGAYVDCSRSGAIRILPTKIASASPNYDATITKAQKGMDQSLTLRTLVTGVEVTAHKYVSTSTSKQLYNGTLSAGTYEVAFTDPMHDLSVSGATIASSGVNYAILTVAGTGTVTLSGQIYLDTTSIYSVYTGGLSSSTKPNILRVTDATLVTSSNGQAIAQRIYDYNQQRYTQKVKLYAPTIQPGETVLIDSLYGQQIRATVEKMTTDLARGFTSQVVMTGVVN